MHHHNAEIIEFKNVTDYEEFLKNKETIIEDSGFEPEELNSNLFDFQRDVVRWALRKGKAALFEDTGLGKQFNSLRGRMLLLNTNTEEF